MDWFADRKSIAAGTRVTTPWGPIPVELLGTLDEVFAFDPITGVRTATRVAEVREARRECVCLQLACGSSLRLTSDHPVWSPATRRFESAGKWATGELQQLASVIDERPGLTTVIGRETYIGVLPVYAVVLAAPHHSLIVEQVVVHC